MIAIVTGYYGHNLREPIDREHTWENIEKIYKDSCPVWYDGTFVSIHREDGGCVYNAPGVFTVTDRSGNKTVVILED